MILFNIITPCYRWKELGWIRDSIIQAIQNADSKAFLVVWYIVFDTTKITKDIKNINDFKNILNSNYFTIIYEYVGGEGISGNLQRNHALDKITNGWICWIDDDNIMHSDYFKIIVPVIRNTRDVIDDGGIQAYNIPKEIQGITYASDIRAGNNISVCNIDTAQFTLKRELIGDTKWDVNRYDADGVFISEIYNNNKDKFIILDDVLCYYNKLR
jgi:hypothetical protein